MYASSKTHSVPVYGKYKISQEERDKREAAFAYATASVGLEGFAVSDAEKALDEQYINGDLTFDERLQATRKLQGLRNVG